MLIIQGSEIKGCGAWNGNTPTPGVNPYQLIKPFFHEYGAARWIIADDGINFQDDDGKVYKIRQRTQAELEATPEYQAWSGTLPLPTIYATMTFQGGDGKDPIGLKLGDMQTGSMLVSGDLRATPDTPGLPVSITYAWRVTIRKIISERDKTTIDSLAVDGCTVSANQIDMVFNPTALQLSPGVYMISDQDFAPVRGALFGLPSDYKVKLIGGDKIFKIVR